MDFLTLAKECYACINSEENLQKQPAQGHFQRKTRDEFVTEM